MDRSNSSTTSAPKNSSPLAKLFHLEVMSGKVQEVLESVITASLCLVVYLFTINVSTRPFALTALVVCAVFISGLYAYQLHSAQKISVSESKTFRILIFTFITAILLWVGNTGWFLSPFFYLLYLVGISLAFLFSTSAAFSFILVLIGILLPNIGSGVNAKVDIATLFSLLLIIPLSYFLRREYLRRIEKEKKILILQQEHVNFKNKVDELLANKMTRAGADLREPINDVRQLALYAIKSNKTKKEDFEKIVEASERALEYIKGFEENVTGRELLSTPKTSKA